MKVWGISTTLELTKIINTVSKKYYKRNLMFNRLEYNGKTIQFTLKVKDSKGPGHRRGLKFLGFDRGYQLGKRLSSACWHAHRDVMKELFKQFPGARLKSMHADYRGHVDFLFHYEETGDINIGGSLFPVRFQDACDCDPPTLDEVLGLR